MCWDVQDTGMGKMLGCAGCWDAQGLPHPPHWTPPPPPFPAALRQCHLQSWRRTAPTPQIPPAQGPGRCLKPRWGSAGGAAGGPGRSRTPGSPRRGGRSAAAWGWGKGRSRTPGSRGSSSAASCTGREVGMRLPEGRGVCAGGPRGAPVLPGPIEWCLGIPSAARMFPSLSGCPQCCSRVSSALQGY